jgi:hypothetical protein
MTNQRIGPATVQQDVERVLAEMQGRQGARSRAPSGEEEGRFFEVDDLIGNTPPDRETAARVNAFLHDPRGTAVHTTTDADGYQTRMRFSRNGDQVQLRVQARSRRGSGEVRGEGRLVNVEGRPEIRVTGLRFRSRNPLANIESAPSSIRIYTDEETGRIRYGFDRPFSVSAPLVGNVYQQDAGSYLANPPPAPPRPRAEEDEARRRRRR